MFTEQQHNWLVRFLLLLGSFFLRRSGKMAILLLLNACTVFKWIICEPSLCLITKMTLYVSKKLRFDLLTCLLWVHYFRPQNITAESGQNMLSFKHFLTKIYSKDLSWRQNISFLWHYGHVDHYNQHPYLNIRTQYYTSPTWFIYGSSRSSLL